MTVCHAPRRPRRSNRTILSETARRRSNRGRSRGRVGRAAGHATVRAGTVRRLRGTVRRDRAHRTTRLGAAPARLRRPVAPQPPPPGRRHRATAPPPGYGPPGYPALRGSAGAQAGGRRAAAARARRLLRRRLQDHPPQPQGHGRAGRRWSPPAFMVVPVLVTLVLAATVGLTASDPFSEPATGGFRRASGRPSAPAPTPCPTCSARSSASSPRWCSPGCWSGWSPRPSSDGPPRSGRRGPRCAGSCCRLLGLTLLNVLVALLLLGLPVLVAVLIGVGVDPGLGFGLGVPLVVGGVRRPGVRAGPVLPAGPAGAGPRALRHRRLGAPGPRAEPRPVVAAVRHLPPHQHRGRDRRQRRGAPAGRAAGDRPGRVRTAPPARWSRCTRRTSARSWSAPSPPRSPPRSSRCSTSTSGSARKASTCS